MQLNQGEAEVYQKRHDEIWPELIDLLHEAGISDYSIFYGWRNSYSFRSTQENEKS